MVITPLIRAGPAVTSGNPSPQPLDVNMGNSRRCRSNDPASLSLHNSRSHVDNGRSQQQRCQQRSTIFLHPVLHTLLHSGGCAFFQSRVESLRAHSNLKQRGSWSTRGVKKIFIHFSHFGMTRFGVFAFLKCHSMYLA